MRDAGLAVPDGYFFAARANPVEERCLLEAPGFVGEIVQGKESAVLRAHPTAALSDLAHFVRVALVLHAFDRGALPLHAAGIVHNGAAYALFGRSGSGKTTAARFSAGRPVLSDDLLLLQPGGMCWQAWATPFGRRKAPGIHSAPLRALLRLVQDCEDSLEPATQAVALGELVANTPLINADPFRSPALLARWEEVTRTTAVHFLHFRKSHSFWETIDAKLG